MPKWGTTIEALRQELEKRVAELSTLQKQRDKLAKELDTIDKQIASLTGKTTGAGRGRSSRKTKTVSVGAGERSPYIGKAIRDLRKKLNMSQEAFGKRIGVSALSVSQWENKLGALNLRKATQAKLAKVWDAEPNVSAPQAEKKAPKAKKATKPAKRARNEKSLAECVAEILKGKSDGMGIKEIAEAVKVAGYQTTSKNFPAVVTLQLTRDKQFKKVGRGVYKLT